LCECEGFDDHAHKNWLTDSQLSEKFGRSRHGIFKSLSGGHYPLSMSREDIHKAVLKKNANKLKAYNERKKTFGLPVFSRVDLENIRERNKFLLLPFAHDRGCLVDGKFGGT